MTTSDVLIYSEESSAWPLLSGAPGRLQCISATVRAPDRTSRLRRADELGDALARAVRANRPDPRLWLLMVSAWWVDAGSRSATLRARRAGLSADMPAGVLQPDMNFDVLDGTDFRQGGAAQLDFGDWGSAVRIMLETPAVAVALPGTTTVDQVKQIATQVFAGREAAELSMGRTIQLRRLLVDRIGLCRGALTVHGAFDDPELAAEYHHFVDPCQVVDPC